MSNVDGRNRLRRVVLMGLNVIRNEREIIHLGVTSFIWMELPPTRFHQSDIFVPLLIHFYFL